MPVQLKGWAARAMLTVAGIAAVCLLFVAIIAGFVLTLILFPFFALRSMFRAGPTDRGGEQPGEWREARRAATVRVRVCPACGHAASGEPIGGVCPRCNTTLGFGAENFHTTVEVEQLPPAKTQPGNGGER